MGTAALRRPYEAQTRALATWGKRDTVSENSQCKGPEVAACSARLWSK